MTDQASGRGAIESGILKTLLYADIFDYPLTADEVYRYLPAVRAPREAVRSVLRDGPASNGLPDA